MTDSTSDSTQDAPIMAGSDEATVEEKSDGRDEQSRADEEFYGKKDATSDNQPEPDPADSRYVNPSSSDLSHEQTRTD